MVYVFKNGFLGIQPLVIILIFLEGILITEAQDEVLCNHNSEAPGRIESTTPSLPSSLEVSCSTELSAPENSSKPKTVRRPKICLQLPEFEKERKLIPEQGLKLHDVQVTHFTKLSNGKTRFYLATLGEKPKQCGILTLPVQKDQTFEVSLDCIANTAQEKLKTLHSDTVRISANYTNLITVNLVNDNNQYCGSMSFKVVTRYKEPWRPISCLSKAEVSALRKLNMDPKTLPGPPRLVLAKNVEGDLRFDFKIEEDDERISAVGILGLDDEKTAGRYESRPITINGRDEGNSSGFLNVDGKNEGEWITEVNGRVTERAHYKNGILHGKFTNYNPDGTINHDGEYDNGLKTGKWINSQGINEHGDQTLESLGSYHNGERTGTWEHYGTDSETGKDYVIRSDNYYNGFHRSSTYHDSQGMTKCQIFFRPSANWDRKQSPNSIEFESMTVFNADGSSYVLEVPKAKTVGTPFREIQEQYCFE